MSSAFVPLHPGEYAELVLLKDEEGYPVGAYGVGIFGFLLNETGDVVAVQTANGLAPNTDPIVGPAGEVTWAGKTWPTVALFLDWASVYVQPINENVH